jgi:hypothetical protein
MPVFMALGLVTASAVQNGHELIERRTCSFSKPVPDMLRNLIWFSKALVYRLALAHVISSLSVLNDGPPDLPLFTGASI